MELTLNMGVNWASPRRSPRVSVPHRSHPISASHPPPPAPDGSARLLRTDPLTPPSPPSQSLEEVCDLLHAAPFQNILPRVHVKGELGHRAVT